MKAIDCPVCKGRGCKNCRGSGVLAMDEQGQQFYVSVDSSGGMRVIGSKEASDDYAGGNLVDRIFIFLEGLLAEPRDLLWVVKQLKLSGLKIINWI